MFRSPASGSAPNSNQVDVAEAGSRFKINNRLILNFVFISNPQ